MRAATAFLFILSQVSGSVVGCREEPAEPGIIESATVNGGTGGKTSATEIEEGEESPVEEIVRSVPEAQPPPAPKDYQAGRMDDVMLVRLFAEPSFSQLDRKNRVLAYHLVRAVLAGRDIAFDQLHKDGLEVRNLVEIILKNSVGKDPPIEAALSDYLKRLWIHGGFYDSFSGEKFMPNLSFEQLERAANTANSAGADLDLAKGEPLEAKLSRLKRVLFDPAYQPVLADPHPPRGKDILVASNLNTYSRVRMKDLKEFQERYPKNSRLIRIEGRLVEEIYRAGDKRRQIPPGRYKQELRRVIRRLQDAMTSASRPQRKVLVDLVEFFRTGKTTAYDSSCQGWRARPFDVEFFLGFTDTRIDPQHTKGLFSGLVGVIDRPNTSRVESIARHVQHFEDSMPWDARHKRRWTGSPVVAAVQLLATTDRNGPLCEPGRTLPSSYLDEIDEPKKILIFSNVVKARQMTVGMRTVEGFVHPSRRKKLLDQLEEILFVHTVVRLVLGPNLGKTPAYAPRRLKNAFPILKFLRSELLSLWLIADPKFQELGLMSTQDTALSAYHYFLAESLVEQALMREEDTRRPDVTARRMIMRYLVEKAKVVGLEDDGGKTYPVISDMESFRQAVRRLMNRCQRILSTADRPEARLLMESYSRPPAWPCLKQVAERARAAGLQRLVACVMPKLSPERDSSGKVNEVTISHTETFERQMMRYRLY